MRILMVGAGATGGYYGGRLAQAGRDITFLVRGTRLKQLQDKGIEIVSPGRDVSVPVKTITADKLAGAGHFDVIIVSTKAYSLEAAMDDFAPAVGPETIVLPVLNGMKHLDVLAARFGRERLMGGSVRIVSDMDEEGRIHQLTELDAFNFGELNAQRTPRAEALLALFSVFGFTTTLADNIVATMWTKWWILATMGAVCIVSGGTVGDAVAVPYGAETSVAILNESVSIAAANGYPAESKMLAGHVKRMTEPGSSLTSSMYRDMTKGYPVEADHILGDFIGRAKEAHVPLLTGAYVRLKVYENARVSNHDNK
jgi:2-dehydropantoate 2-reductase